MSRSPEHQPLRFVLVFHARSGSNMLRSALNSHPNIRCEREVFRSRPEASHGQPVYPATRKITRLLVEEPEAFLERELFGQQPSKVHARGFKLAFGHAREAEWASVWKWLADHRVHVIQMERRNLLAAFVSQERARLSGEFVARTAADAQSPMTLQPERCMEFFEAVRRREDEARTLFEHNPRIVVAYEDLVADQEATLLQIQHFLEVTPTALEPQTKRQSSWDPLGQLRNHDELELAFRDTPFNHFLAPEGTG